MVLRQLPTPNVQLPTRRLDRLGVGSAKSVGRWELTLTLATLVLLGVAVSSCGKKGPPLAPIARIPAAVPDLTARRLGHDVYLTLTIPAQNIDQSTPAAVRRIDIYGVTAMAPPPRGRFFEMATVVASVPVAEVPDDAVAPPALVVDSATGEAQQGMAVTILDSLAGDELVPRPVPPPPAGSAPPLREIPQAGARNATPEPTVPRRFYLAVGLNERGRPGPPSPVLELPLTALPDPPSAIDATYTIDAVTVSWPPSGGLVGFLMENALPAEPSPVDEAAASAAAPGAPTDLPAGRTRYNVYVDLAPDPLATPDPSARASTPATWSATLPPPLTPAPIDTLSLTDALQFDRERCYTVRAVRGTPPQAVEGDPSPRTCITPVDTFPPAAPGGLAAVAAEGVISLIWEPNAELDLSGYRVLRGRAGDDTLLPLSDIPAAAARYVDRSVESGVRYVYAIVALDSRVPLPNVSEESARIEETAR
jgi:hypothetical protein